MAGYFVALLLNAESLSTREKSAMRDSAPAVADGVAASKPPNGLRGLKRWRNELRAGLMAAMIALPFSTGSTITAAIEGLLAAIRERKRIPAEAREVLLHITEDVALLDRTTGQVG